MHTQKHYVIYVTITFLLLPGVNWAGSPAPLEINLSGQYLAQSWMHSQLGEMIKNQKDLNLTLVHEKENFYMNSMHYLIDNNVHVLPKTKSDKYKAFWAENGAKLVIETYVSSDGTYKLDKNEKPVKTVSNFFFTEDDKHLVWETVYPEGFILTRKYEKISVSTAK